MQELTGLLCSCNDLVKRFSILLTLTYVEQECERGNSVVFLVNKKIKKQIGGNH